MTEINGMKLREETLTKTIRKSVLKFDSAEKWGRHRSLPMF